MTNMHHTKLIIFGLVCAAVVIFGFAFWGDFFYSAQDLSNNPKVTQDLITEQPKSEIILPPREMSNSDAIADIEADLSATDVDNLDAELNNIEAESAGL